MRYSLPMYLILTNTRRPCPVKLYSLTLQKAVRAKQVANFRPTQGRPTGAANLYPDQK